MKQHMWQNPTAAKTFFTLILVIVLGTTFVYIVSTVESVKYYSAIYEPNIPHHPPNISIQSVYQLVVQDTATSEVKDGGYTRWRPGPRKPREEYRFKVLTKPDVNYKLDVNHLPTVPVKSYFQKAKNGLSCFISGTNFSLTTGKNCSCLTNGNFLQDYAGQYCSIPGSVWRIHTENFPIRSKPRRVVMGMIVNHELSFTEIRFFELEKVVDVFVILESPITSGGDPKPLNFFNAMRGGFLREFQHKILYVYLPSIPPDYIADGWLAEAYVRNYMSLKAVERIEGLQGDDLFLSFDADEIPKAEVVLFLKIHDQISEPIQFNTRWSVFTYYWAHNGETTNPLVAGCTMDYLKKSCMNNIYYLRNQRCVNTPTFQIGLPGNYAGHHCSWCFTPEGIREKLTSAQRADRPRWGDYPEKLEVSYLENIIQKGVWFDGTKNLELVLIDEDPDFAPLFVLSHFKKYQNLLVPPKHVIEQERSQTL